MLKKLFIIIIFIYSIFSISNVYGVGLDITVSPIKYDIEYSTGKTINKTIKVFNNTDKEKNIYITYKNAIAENNTGQPKFIEEIDNPELHLAGWISSDIKEFKMGPESIKDIPITIKVPGNATPGGHYAAVFFNVKENEEVGKVNIKKRIGVIMMLKVPGEINVDGDINDIQIGGGGSGGYGWGVEAAKNKEKNNSNNNNNIPEIDLDSEEENNNNDDNDLNIDFSFNFTNSGNIHIKPIGKIEITDKDGNVIKDIGKETIKDKNGVKVGEKIVDYIPINDEGSNVLPNKNIIFKQCWRGIAEYITDENGKTTIKFKNPYGKEKKDRIAFPWEKVCFKDKIKKFTAKINIIYKDEDGNDIEYNSAKDFNLKYKEKSYCFNTDILRNLFSKYDYCLICIIPIFLILLLLLILLFKRKKCPKCKKKIKKDMKVCPYCGYKLKKKK